ncbi:uncharacterized protein LOC113564857 [Drosophila erecta]|uniref:uncharacterized protein LOC113564857 n=1 Tax=Drosophila erecta TaxID=7220 RepID=UPI000F050072|nr:uncharacterized protein LOC113564857 [Drosophila erecta]
MVINDGIELELGIFLEMQPFFSPNCISTILNDPIQRHFAKRKGANSQGVKWCGELHSQSATCDGHQLNPSQQPASNTSERLTLLCLPVASGCGPLYGSAN